VRRAAELALIARNAATLLIGARLTDGQALTSLDAEADACLGDARTRFGLPEHWAPAERLTTVADVAVVELRSGPELAAVLKLARSLEGDASLLLQQQVLQQLAGDPALGQWRRLLPRVLAHGVVRDRRYSIEAAVPGTVGTALSRSARTPESARAAVRAIAGLHRATGRAEVVDCELLDRWLEPALSLVADVPMLLRSTRRRGLLDRLGERVRSGLQGRTVWVGRTHGDYFSGNVFSDPTGDVTGIIDWGQSREGEPALIDPVTLLLAGRSEAQGVGLGRVVADLCRDVRLTADELDLVETHRAACPADPVGADVTALLAWLRHVENNLLKSPRYRSHPAWVRSTVETVLEAAGASGR
jgi:Ser/Thr protein kinase RdoA (MazF antagonist)